MGIFLVSLGVLVGRTLTLLRMFQLFFLISNLLHPVECFTHESKSVVVDSKSNVSTSNNFCTPSTVQSGLSNTRKRKLPQSDKVLVSNVGNDVCSSLITCLPAFNRVGKVVGSNLNRRSPPFVGRDSRKRIGANVIGLRKSARISQKLAHSAQQVIHGVSDISPLTNPTIASNHPTICLGKRKRPMVVNTEQPAHLSSVTDPAAFLPTDDIFDSQTIPRPKPSGVWSIFKVNQTGKLRKRKRSSEFNFKQPASLSPKCGHDHFFSHIVNFQAQPEVLGVNEFDRHVQHGESNPLQHNILIVSRKITVNASMEQNCGPVHFDSDIDNFHSKVRTPSGKINRSSPSLRAHDSSCFSRDSPDAFTDSVVYASGSTDVQIAESHFDSDMVNFNFHSKDNFECKPSGLLNTSEVNLTTHWTEHDTKHDSPAQEYIRHADGDSASKLALSSAVFRHLSVTSDRDINGPSLTRASNLTTTSSLNNGINDGKGVPDNEL